MDINYRLSEKRKRVSLSNPESLINGNMEIVNKIKGNGTLDKFVTRKPRNDLEMESNGVNLIHSKDDDESVSPKKPKLDIENLDESCSDIKSPDEVFRSKKYANPFDSSDSESDQSEYEKESETQSPDKMKILDYFNNGSLDELLQISGCSEMKSQKIIDGRPYGDMRELRANKVVTDGIIDGCRDIFETKRNVSRLLTKCEQLSANLTRRIKPFMGSTELSSVISENGIIGQPKNLANGLLLKDYQLVGINWLRILYEENLNGILADEMGLGKTIQTIVFLSHLYDIGMKGPHIVIVPMSTINNWERELKTWCPHFKVVIYHGSQSERSQLRYEISNSDTINVLLTTYNTSISNKDDRIFIKKMNFHYGVFDEAHMLKNMMSIRYQYLNNFKIKRKLLLTGTPLQNNFVELISLLSFVMPEMFLTSNVNLKKIFQMSQKSPQLTQSKFNDNKIRQIKDMLAPFCLRRLKSQVLSQMPTKTVDVVLLPLTEEQSQLYSDFIQHIDTRKLDNNPVSRMSAIVELRKISNHSLLTKHRYTDDILRKMSRDMLLDEDHITANQQLIFEDFSIMHDFEIHSHCLQYPHAIGKYRLADEVLLESSKIQYLDEHLPEMIANGDRILIFSQFLMVLDIIGAFLKYRDLPFLRLDGSTSSDDRQDYIDYFNESDDVNIFLLSTKAGGLGINLAKANTVILHDIDYNPYNDRQAEDRSHRIGQLRDVRVIKLVSKDTIEECMLRIATDKLRLEQITANVEVDDDDGEGQAGTGDTDGKDIDFTRLLEDAMTMRR